MNIFFLDKEANLRITVFLLKNVPNVKELRAKIISGELDCCAIKPALIFNCFQIVAAANKAALSKAAGKLTTKSLNTELLYNLSISKHITQSLNKFGIDDKDKHAVIVVFEEENADDSKIKKIKSILEGQICDIGKNNLTNINLIKKAYKISDKELEVSPLIDSIVSRIATKDFGSY